jgi:hypothetical protein
LTLVAGPALPGAVVALTPSTAGAAGTDPIGPTITQLEQFYATALANTEATLNLTELVIAIGNLTRLPFCLLNAGPDPYCAFPGPGGGL